MINKRKLYILSSCTIIVTILFYMFNAVFLYKIYEDSTGRSLTIEEIIEEQVKRLEPYYFNINPKVEYFRLKLIRNFKYSDYQPENVWDFAKNWINYEYGIYNPNDHSVGKVLKALRYEPILNATNAAKGTQLKLLLYFNSLQNVLFKPQWYSRSEIIDGSVYAGKDRHNAEIYSFYLASVLNLPWAPLVVGRKINLKEIYHKGDILLKKTMFVRDANNNSNYCLFGKCYYCKKNDFICGDDENLIEGAVILIIPGNLKKERSPWQRTYKSKLKAKWEENMNFCKILSKNIDINKLLDYIDVSIFDYIIQNGDRHHYETIQQKIVLLDNGKSFANPYKDFFDILAPLYQCCIIRNETWNNLQIVSGGTLTSLVDEILKYDELSSNIITYQHKKAIERRLIYVYGTVNYCIEKFGKDSVLVN